MFKNTSLHESKKVVDKIAELERDDTDALNNYISSVSSSKAKNTISILVGDKVKEYLTTKHEGELIIRPVNVVRYELFKRLENNDQFDIKSTIQRLKNSIIDRKGDDFKYLNEEYKKILRDNGYGKENAYDKWTDDRKFILPLILNPINKEEIIEELNALGNHILQVLGMEHLNIRTWTPDGPNNNSFQDFVTITFSEKYDTQEGKKGHEEDRLKETVHMGVRFNSRGFFPCLHIGSTLRKEIDPDEFPYLLEKNDDFLIKKCETVSEVIDHLRILSKICETFENKEIPTDRPSLFSKERIEFTFKTPNVVDTEKLHQSGERNYQIKHSGIETKSFYFIKIDGVNFNDERCLYKIGVSDNVERRYKEIASGFGMKDLVKITQLCHLTLGGDKELQVKSSLISMDKVEYCNEYFLTDINEEELLSYIETFLCIN